MKLLVVTQKVDKEDENLGAFYYWFEEFAKKVESMAIIADAVGTTYFPPHVQVEGLGKDKGRGRTARLWKFWELFSYYYARSDAVFFHQIPEFVLASSPFLLSLKRTSALWYAHGTVTKKLKLAERLVDHIFTSSPSGFRLPSKKVWHLGQAINTDLFKPSLGTVKRQAGLQMITIGRLSPSKNYENIIKACSHLKEKWIPPWTLSIVGGPIMPRDHQYLTSLKKLVNESGLHSQVHFYGPRPYSEIPSLLLEHNLFINLSATGSLDKAVLEAMASGLTVLTSNEAYRTLLPPQYFLSHASPKFLAERIMSLVNLPRPNQELHNVVKENHGLEKTVNKIISILSEPRYKV